MEQKQGWQPELPAPSSENWRRAYGAIRGENEKRFTYYASENPAQTGYQAPGQAPVPFVYDGMKLSSGLAVDTAEFPFFGLWSSTALNEKPHGISVSGFLRGDNYIKNRNALVEALRVVTTDDDPGYLHLPLWGRFPVIIIDWDIEESAKELGQCKIQLTFTRAGCPVDKRWQLSGELSKTIPEAAEAVKIEALKTLETKLSGNTEDATLINSFGLIQKKIFETVGRIQGGFKILNDMTNEAAKIGSLIAQGVRSPKELALALFAAAGKIVIALAEIKNAGAETVSFFRIKNNEKNAVFCFLSEYKYSLPVQAVTVKQRATKKEIENIYKIVCLYTAAQVLPEVSNQSYERAVNLFNLYTRLEKSIDLNEPAVYTAVNDLHTAVSKELAAKQLAQELSIHLTNGMPLLALAAYVGSEERVLRSLNIIEDSFVVKGGLRYV